MDGTSKPVTEERPWGKFITFVHNAPLTVKLLTIERGQAFSLQKHSKRDEQWHVISGNGTITIGLSTADIIVGGDYAIPRDMLHRLQANTEPLVVLEIAYGDFDENDITRVEDLYGRT